MTETATRALALIHQHVYSDRISSTKSNTDKSCNEICTCNSDGRNCITCHNKDMYPFIVVTFAQSLDGYI